MLATEERNMEMKVEGYETNDQQHPLLALLLSKLGVTVILSLVGGLIGSAEDSSALLETIR